MAAARCIVAGVRSRRRGRAAGTARILAAPAVAIALLSGCGGDGGDAVGRSDGLVALRSVSYTSAFDGERVTGSLAVPRALASRGCVIWQYDAGSTKETSAPAWQGLGALGLSGFAIDLRFHGARASSPDEHRRALQDPGTFRELVRGSVGDLRSAVSYLERQRSCARNIAYVGIGLGGAIGTILAAGDPRVKAVALVATPGTWSGVSAVGGGDASLDPARFIGRIAPREVLVLSGDADRVVSRSSARALRAAARRPSSFVEYRGGHDPAVGPDATANAETIFSFLLRVVVEPSYGIDGGADGTFKLQR